MGATALRPGVALEDRYTAESGPVLISGIQALVRVMLEQRRLDRERGLETGVYASGYPGSPLGGLDQELARARKHLDPLGIVAHPGLNEELAATAVAGTQLLGTLEGRRVQGVTGFWYGKNPGLDRAADAIRHGNVSGTDPRGGAVALIGDDPWAKSSTLPSACEPMCRSLGVPLLAPGTVGEVLELGLHAVALSRFAGVWAGLRIVADTADASATVDAGAARAAIRELPTRTGFHPPILLAPSSVHAEEDLFGARLDRARQYARLAGLNQVEVEPFRPRLAILAAGPAHQAVVRALVDLGLDAGGVAALGIRLVRLGMSWPLDREEIRGLLSGVETVLVAEDKVSFLEGQVKEALYRTAHPPFVVGREDAEGRPLLPARGAVTADDIAGALGRLLPGEELPERARARLAELAGAAEAPAPAGELPSRTPYFCSGCPHNTSTRARPGELVGVGIGCHTMIALDDGDRRGELTGMPQMGGEGAQWIGLSPFTDQDHFVQNLGDGTFHHSGSLAIRASVAAGVNVTYRLLYNSAVAMTGGQTPEGRLDVPALTRWLALEGVRRVIVTTPEPERYRGVELDRVAEVRHRDDFAAIQAELAGEPGVTVIIHDDRCAAEKRRLRKRGKLDTPPERVWINERVCEGCGDCGEQSTCLSVQPVETEFGRKTTIDQASCNYDMSCLKGDCPSFVVVTPREGAEKAAKARAATDPPAGLPDPEPRVPRDVLVRMTGVGGTGVVTVSAILQMAAHLDGRWAAGLEQTGLAQKGGPVLSDLRIASTPITGAVRASEGAADLLLGFDLLGAAAAPSLAVAHADRTVTVLNTGTTPTARMVTDTRAAPPDVRLALRRVDRVSRAEEAVRLDALGLADRLWADHMPANLLLVGAAFQHGCLPLSAAAIEHAIELNGAAVEKNLAAFRWGRAAVADPEAVAAATAPAEPSEPAEAGLDPVARRVGELTAYQSAAYARRYAAAVEHVATLERERLGEEAGAVTRAYAEGLFKLMAYKDEYEVARLHLLATERARLEAEFGPGARAQVMLHPPLLRALGMKRKIRVGRSARPLFGALRAGRRLRGTPLDPFGHTRLRRVERGLVAEYQAVIDAALEHLSPRTARQVASIAALPDGIRGYEEIKLGNVEAFRAQAAASLEHLTALDRPEITAARAGAEPPALRVVAG